LNRFDVGSIYDLIGKKTKRRVGPGAYESVQAVDKLRKKPCLSKILKPTIGEQEECYEIVNNTRILQVNYLPKRDKDLIQSTMDDVSLSHKGGNARIGES